MCGLAPAQTASAKSGGQSLKEFHERNGLDENTEHIHLLGIAGSAMAPVAGMLKERGFRVTGSDVNVYPPASTLLDSLGIQWNEGFREENLQPGARPLRHRQRQSPAAIPRWNTILDQKIPYCSMPQLLEDYFIPGHTSIVVSRHARQRPPPPPCSPGFSRSPAGGRIS